VWERMRAFFYAYRLDSMRELLEALYYGAILRTFFERKGLTNEATNWLNVVIESYSYFNR
jgi:hypothetical protein